MKITVLGAGAFGLALALNLNKNCGNVVVWTKFESERDEIVTNQEYKAVLPGVKIPSDIKITTNLEDIKNSGLVVIAVPAKFVRSTLEEVKEYINTNTHFLIASKGIEQDTCKFLNEVLLDVIDTDNVSVISGPTFAIDLSKDTPVGLTLASNNKNTIEIVKKNLGSDKISLVENNDIIGVEVCGSVKNILAIASGMLDGMGVSLSTKSLFYTVAIDTMRKLIVALGGKNETILSLAGIGDFILTCTSDNSRNYSYGKLFATNGKLEADQTYEGKTVEGIYTLEAVYQIMIKKQINLPLMEAIYNILINDKNKKELLNSLIRD